MKINKENLRSLIREQMQPPRGNDRLRLGVLYALDDFYSVEIKKLSAEFADQDEMKDHLAASLTDVFMEYMRDMGLDRRVDITEY